MKKLMTSPGVMLVRADMCQFGMQIPTAEGDKFVKKATGFLTNAIEVARELGRRCEGNHAHATIDSGAKCKLVQVYPLRWARRYAGEPQRNGSIAKKGR